MDTETAIELRSLAKDIFRRKDRALYCLFLGAGASVPYAPPTSALVEGLLEELYPGLTQIEKEQKVLSELKESGLPAKIRLEPISELYKTKREARALKEYLRTKFSDSDIPEGYSALARMVKKGYFKIIFTTNIDDLLEKAFLRDHLFKEDQFEVLVSEEDYSCSIAYSVPRIYKLHGTYTKINAGVCYKELEELPPKKLAHLQHFWENYDFVFLGYSAEDADIFDALKKPTKEARRGYVTLWLKKSKGRDKVIEIMSKYSHLNNLLAVGDTQTGSEVFLILEKELLELSRLVKEKGAEDLVQQRASFQVL